MEEVGPSTKLNPNPGYVLKTRLLKSTTVQIGTKIFINVCQDSQVPKPSQDFEPSIVFPLIVDNKWEIPIIVSQEKETKDKSGQSALCYDCCINDKCFRWCMINADLKSILNEWCLEAVELLYNIVVDRQYSIPKMLHKGPLSATEIKQQELVDDGLSKKFEELKNNEPLALLEELNDPMDVDDVTIDIFNKPTKKILIEEIDEPSQSKPITPPAKTTNISSTSIQQKLKVDYNVNFKKLDHNKHSLLIKFKSNLPCECLKLYHDDDNIIISCTNPHYEFSELKIPAPQSTNYKSFFIGDELLTFC